MVNRIVIPALCCNLISFVAGIALTWSSPIVTKLSSSEYLDENPFDRLISEDEQSWIGSMMSLGAIFGPIFSYGADRFGRKWTILSLGIPPLIAYLILAFAETVELYYVGRFLAGFSLGGTFTLIPIYIGEIAEDSNRGAFGVLLTLFATLGSLFSYSIGPYVPILWFNIICAIIPALFIAVFFVVAPESPYYYMKKGDEQRSEEILRKLRTGECKGELMAIKEATDKSKEGSILDIFKSKGLKKATITSLSLIFFQQLSGITAVLFYAQTIFDASGSDIDSAVSSIIVGAVQVATSLTTPLVADRFRKRTLFLISAIGMIISEVPLGIYFYLKDDGQDVSNIGWLPVVALVVYIITYNFALAGLPWAIMGELFPPSVKSAASALTVSFCWILGFLITKFFQDIADAVGMGESFWIFAGFCCIFVVFIQCYLIETKGKSLQEIQNILES